jgi:hypothetical protein
MGMPIKRTLLTLAVTVALGAAGFAGYSHYAYSDALDAFKRASAEYQRKDFFTRRASIFISVDRMICTGMNSLVLTEKSGWTTTMLTVLHETSRKESKDAMREYELTKKFPTRRSSTDLSIAAVKAWDTRPFWVSVKQTAEAIENASRA